MRDDSFLYCFGNTEFVRVLWFVLIKWLLCSNVYIYIQISFFVPPFIFYNAHEHSSGDFMSCFGCDTKLHTNSVRQGKSVLS